MAVVIRARKFITNKLLSRKQMVFRLFRSLTWSIPNWLTCPKISSKNKFLKNTSATKEVSLLILDIVLFGFKTVFGGGRSTGFCLIYDAHQYLLKYEPRYRLQRAGILNKKKYTRKGYKEIKGKCKRTRGKEITKLMGLKYNTPLDVRK